MRDEYRERLKKDQVLTVPNLLSFFRLALIPVIIWLALGRGQYAAAAAVVLLSAATDVADGWIARTFHQVTDFGKLIDPVADKLTQATLVVCLLSRYIYAAGLLVLLAVKEAFQFVCGLLVFRRHKRVHSSRWFGKVSTVVFYAVMLVLFLFPEIDPALAYALFGLCVAFLLLSAVGYGVFYIRGGLLTAPEEDAAGNDARDPAA